MRVRLSHPYKWHRTLDVLDLPDEEARRLVRGGIAKDVDELITPTGGGWFLVSLSAGKTEKVRGYKAALRALNRDAW